MLRALRVDVRGAAGRFGQRSGASRCSRAARQGERESAAGGRDGTEGRRRAGSRGRGSCRPRSGGAPEPGVWTAPRSDNPNSFGFGAVRDVSSSSCAVRSVGQPAHGQGAFPRTRALRWLQTLSGPPKAQQLSLCSRNKQLAREEDKGSAAAPRWAAASARP